MPWKLNSAPMKRNSPFTLSASFDFPSDLSFGMYTPELIEDLMYRLKSMGVTRLNWLYYGDVDQDSDLGGALNYFWKYAPQTMTLVGEPVKAAAAIAKRVGIELYAVLKPFHNGLSGTHPEGSPRANSTGLPHVGGWLQLVDPFVRHNPHMRCRRRPVEWQPGLESTEIRCIRLLKSDDSPTRIGERNLQIWTSDKNFAYQRKDVEFTVTDAIEPSPNEVCDFYGNLITVKGSPVRTLTLNGLKLSERYILVTTNFTGGNDDFSNTAQAMVEAYGPGPEPLPISVATRTALWANGRDFRIAGLEFDSGMGAFQAALDADNSAVVNEGLSTTEMRERSLDSPACGGVIAFARGKNEYLPTTVCESYPEVRHLWRGWVDQLLDAGVDGIELRASAHSSFADDFKEYGFNEPVVDEYCMRFGVYPTNDPTDLKNLSMLRGEHYTAFVRETSERVRARGKKLNAHLHAEAFRPNPCPGQILGFPGNLHFAWQTWLRDRLLDGVTLRTSWNEALEESSGGRATGRSKLSQVLADSVVAEMLDVCQTSGVPVSLQRYIARSTDIAEYLADLEAIYDDSRFSGFDLYEVVHMYRADPTGSRLTPFDAWVDAIASKTAQIGLRPTN